MNRDKIEEMKKLQDRLIKRSCTEYNTVTSMYLVEASKAIGTLLEGYRKASDVAREIFAEIEEALEQAKEIADIRIRELAPHTYKVMRGVGELYHKHDSNAIAELKKKHESEGEK